MPKQLKLHEKQYQVYALVDPRDDSIRYVGMSADANYRFYQHMQRDGGRQEVAWIKELQLLNLSPILKILETVNPNDYSTACERERYWMQSLQESGYSLLNVFGTKRAYHSYSPLRVNRKPSTGQSGEANVIAFPISIATRKHVTKIQPTLMTTEKHEFAKLLENMPASQAELARLSGVNERTIIRMKSVRLCFAVQLTKY